MAACFELYKDKTKKNGIVHLSSTYISVLFNEKTVIGMIKNTIICLRQGIIPAKDALIE